MLTFVQAVQTFFSDNSDGYGRKVEVPEFKALTTQDKTDLSELLLAAGVEHIPYAPVTA